MYHKEQQSKAVKKKHKKPLANFTLLTEIVKH